MLVQKCRCPEHFISLDIGTNVYCIASLKGIYNARSRRAAHKLLIMHTGNIVNVEGICHPTTNKRVYGLKLHNMPLGTNAQKEYSILVFEFVCVSSLCYNSSDSINIVCVLVH